jgi:ParB family transcriptional regulator, chromosome partitioning protein
MTNKRRGGLGSGLSALLPSQPSLREVPVASIRPNPHQPREQFDEQALADLAASIKEHGVLQPLLVTSHADGYELIAGERRWRAAQRAGLATVPVVVKEVTAQELLELAIIENVQRADLNPIEEARAYQSLKDEFALSDERIAELVGQRKRETITNARRLLGLPLIAQQALLDGRITAGHGRALLMIKRGTAEEEQHEQAQALALTLTEGLSVRKLEQLAHEVSRGSSVTAVQQRWAGVAAVTAPPAEVLPSTPRSSPPSPSPEDSAAVAALQQALNTPVALQRGERGHKLVITFYDDEQLHAIYERLTRDT